MPDTLVLGKIYVLLSVICYVYVLSTSYHFISFVFKKKVDSIELRQKAFHRKLEDFFVRDKMDKVHAIADEILGKEPNNTTALYWKIRAHHRMNERSKMTSASESLLNADPAYRDFVKSIMRPDGS